MLNSASTNAEVWAAYDDNASYEEDASRTKALAFITACRIILRRRPASTGRGEQTVSFESIRDEMQRAREWLTANPRTDGSGRPAVRFGSLENFKDEC
jgi:hypothetical protein